MNKVKNLLLTFDYEPFLGVRSGSVEKCMLEPVNALRRILNTYNAKAIFFVDTLYLGNLKKHARLEREYNAIARQLKLLNEDGHYIFPHIHPHWIDSRLMEDINEFSLPDLSHYSLASLQKSHIETLFLDSIKSLNDLAISYPQWGYRAGGWCIQPFSSLKDIFISQHIYFDFSVLPGYKNDAENQSFDFSMVANNMPYSFYDFVEKVDLKGAFVEFPISTIDLMNGTGILDKIVKKYLWKIGDKGWGDGISARTAALKFNLTNREMISIELLNISKLGQYKKYLQNEVYMHWISHPKMFTRHGLKMFDYFLKFANNNFDLNYDFHKMTPVNS